MARTIPRPKRARDFMKVALNMMFGIHLTHR
jgi:hypothetical protein